MAENCTTFSKENQETYVFLFSVQAVRYIIEYVPVINLKQYAKKRMEISFAKVLSDYTLSSSLRMQKKNLLGFDNNLSWRNEFPIYVNIMILVAKVAEIVVVTLMR